MDPADFSAMQLILPTDKRNPSFTLYLSADERRIHVFYGLELFEVVPSDPKHVAYKLLAARLYNAQVRLRTLVEIFQIDPKTMRAWGRALKAEDPALLQRLLLGPEAGRKLTAAIVGYVRHRWPQLRSEGCRNYRENLQQEIERIFGTRLSGETLRLLLAQITAEEAPSPGATATAPEPEEEPDEARPHQAVGDLAATGPGAAPLSPSAELAPEEVVPDPALRESSCEEATEGEAAPAALLPSVFPGENAAGGADRVATPAPGTSKSIPSFWAPRPGTAILCDHAGLLLFASALGSLPGAVEPPEPLLAQWLGSVLLGAANVEQTKFLNWEDLGLLLGSVVRFPTTQREALQRLATPATVAAVLRWNLQQIGPAGEGTDLYLDPHTVHYTGMQSVLKGWCAALRWADKLINSDFVHTAQGHPIYFECGDNYEDLRTRFAPLIDRLRATLQWEPTRVLTFVIDRGIYSHDVFTQVLADPGVHLITWQKGYVASPWDASAVSGSYGLEKRRNNNLDVRLYQFAYIDGKSATHEGLRQIVVRATNPVGECAQLAILTDDLTRPAAEIVRLMFSRWIQENDFKYLDKHFGINQITSYRSIPYEQLREGLTDRLVPSHLYVQKAKAGQALLKQKARLLIVEDQARRAEEARQQRLAELEKPRVAPPLPETSPEPALEASTGILSPATAATAATDDVDAVARRKELTALKSASQRFEKYRAERAQRIESLHAQLLQNQAEKDAMQKEVSRLDQLIGQGMVRLDTGNKTLMDAIKITARNLFYRVFAPFKTAYNNYRDDHDYFRELTQSGGVLRWSGQEIEVHLVPQVNYAPKLRKIIGTLLQGLNDKGQPLPDGSGRPLRLRLTNRDQIEVRVRDTPET